jgi:hypothetical protein
MVQWAPTNRTLTGFLRVFPYVVYIGKFALIGRASPINIPSERLIAELAGLAGEYMTKMGWNRNEVAALISGLPQTWTPHDAREDRDVNTDIFPKDEYYRNSRKIDLLGEDRARTSDTNFEYRSVRETAAPNEK